MNPIQPRKTLHSYDPCRALAAAAVLALALSAAPAAQAEDFHVYGKVYAAAPPVSEDSKPYDPLEDQQESAIIRAQEDLYAVAPTNMVRVSLLDPASDQRLAFDVARYEGWYNLTFKHAGSSRNVRFTVHDAVSGQLLFRSGEVTVTKGKELRWLLVPATLLQSGRPRGLADADTGLFTRVGKIEVDLIAPNNVARNLRSSVKPEDLGLATVPSDRARKLQVPTYQKAPFGGNLYLFGAFSKRFYPGGTSVGEEYCYQILVDGQPLSDPLFKTRYTVESSSLKVTAESVQLGPFETRVGGCYKLTPRNESGDVFWSFPDLLAIWRTGSQSGKKKVTLRLYQISSGRSTGFYTPIGVGTNRVEGFLPEGGSLAGTSLFNPALVSLSPNDNSTLILRLHNEKPVVELGLTVGGTTPGDCDMLDLSGSQKLDIAYKVKHPYLRNWALWRSSNDPRLYKTWKSDGPLTAREVDTTLKGADFPESCAYNIRLSAWARTTDGYGYLYWNHAEKTHYVKVKARP